MKKMNKKGFTLVELLAVIVVTSLVLGLSGYGIINAYKKTKEKTVVLNETSILKAAEIYSSEAADSEWKNVDGEQQYFCTTIQRLKNAGLLKKEATSEEHNDTSIITVVRNSSTYSIGSVEFLSEEDTEISDLCDISFFTIHYDYNVDEENGTVPSDQFGEVCENNGCSGIIISPYIPKRDGYKFISWNSERDGSGNTYTSGDMVYNEAKEVITLYAQWLEDTYLIKYDGNIDNVSGTTTSTKCFRKKNCSLTQNGFTKEGYTFTGWNTKRDGSGTLYKDGQIVNNLTTQSEKTLYAMWKSKYKAIIKFNVGNNGVIRETTTSDSGINYHWTTDSNGIIFRSKNNGSFSDEFFTINYSNMKHLPDYNNSKYMYITNSVFSVSSGSVWKCTSGECLGETYNQTDLYSSDDFCNALLNNCTVILTVNWEDRDLLSPIITPSDDIISGHWHNSNYTLSISSENTGAVAYEYKADSNNYQSYSSAVSPSEGITIYIARTKVGNQYSGEVSYVSKLDVTPPSAPTISNPTNGNWTNNSFTLSLHSTDNLSGIAYYQYRYDNNDWVAWANSATEDYETPEFSRERNELVYVRACDNAGNCSNESSTYIRIDKMAPAVPSVDMRKWTSTDYSNYLSDTHNNVTSVGSRAKYTNDTWYKYPVFTTAQSSDNGSGINHYEVTVTGKSSNVTNARATYRNIVANGLSNVKYRACDNAGNCSNYSTNFTIKVDKNIPTISFKFLNGSTEQSSDYYSSAINSNLKPFTFAPTLKWTVNDSLSKPKTTIKIYYNSANSLSDPSEFIGNTSVSGISNNSANTNYSYAFSPGSGGYRMLKAQACDNAGNCVEDTKYFKYCKDCATVNKYVNAIGGLNCRSGPDTSSSVVTTVNCGTRITGLIKYFNTSWYYDSGRGCYLNQSYLVDSTPNCSSGGGSSSSGVAQCGTCSNNNQCTINGQEGRCNGGKCEYLDRSGNWSSCN